VGFRRAADGLDAGINAAQELFAKADAQRF
jgi:hypothetical protein